MNTFNLKDSKKMLIFHLVDASVADDFWNQCGKEYNATNDHL